MSYEITCIDETMDMLQDTICIVAYDYVNTSGDNTCFFNKMRYLVHRYDEEAQRKAMLIYNAEMAEKIAAKAKLEEGATNETA